MAIDSTDSSLNVYPTTPKSGDSTLTSELTVKQGMAFQSFNSASGGSATALLIGGLDGQRAGSGGGGGVTTTPDGRPCSTDAVYANMTVLGLPIAWPGSYSYFRRVLADPSVRLVRMISYAPTLASEWVWTATKDAPKEALETIQNMFNPLRDQYFDDAVRSDDFGWQPFEKIYQEIGGVFTCTKLKNLLPDLTGIYVTDGGGFDGFGNMGKILDRSKGLLLTYDGEGGNLYGRGNVRNLLEVIPWWNAANQAAAQYDKKVAGVFLVLHYPPGQSVDKDGNVVENSKIAQQILNRIAAGNPIAVCNEFAGEAMVGQDFLSNVTQADRVRWRFEMLSDQSTTRATGFTERLTYLDKLKARAWLVPERAVFEAQRSGSKADSESMGEIIPVMAQLRGNRYTDALNGLPSDPTSTINTVLRMNWGPKAIGTVTVKCKAIADDTKKFLREITKQLLMPGPTNQLSNTASNVGKIFEESGMPAPTDPLTDEAVNVVLDDMAAMSVKLPLGGKVPTKPQDARTAGADKVTLARIHEAMDLQDSKRVNRMIEFMEARSRTSSNGRH